MQKQQHHYTNNKACFWPWQQLKQQVTLKQDSLFSAPALGLDFTSSGSIFIFLPARRVASVESTDWVLSLTLGRVLGVWRVTEKGGVFPRPTCSMVAPSPWSRGSTCTYMHIQMDVCNMYMDWRPCIPTSIEVGLLGGVNSNIRR